MRLAGVPLAAFHPHMAPGDVQPQRAPGAWTERNRRVRRHAARVQVHVLVHRDRSVAAVTGCDQMQTVLEVGGRKRTLFVGWGKTFALRQQPDLQEVHGVACGRIEFRVGDAGARAHALQFARTDHAVRAHAVLVFERAVEHPRQDFHVAV
jgi:hypothetical protein